MEGGPFGSVCAPLIVEQNGRHVSVDGTGKGSRVHGGRVNSSRGTFEFQADLSSPDTTTGSYALAGTTDVLGQWSAERSP